MQQREWRPRRRTRKKNERAREGRIIITKQIINVRMKDSHGISSPKKYSLNSYAAHLHNTPTHTHTRTLSQNIFSLSLVLIIIISSHLQLSHIFIQLHTQKKKIESVKLQQTVYRRNYKNSFHHQHLKFSQMFTIAMIKCRMFLTIFKFSGLIKHDFSHLHFDIFFKLYSNES